MRGSAFTAKIAAVGALTGAATGAFMSGEFYSEAQEANIEAAQVFIMEADALQQGIDSRYAELQDEIEGHERWLGEACLSLLQKRDNDRPDSFDEVQSAGQCAVEHDLVEASRPVLKEAREELRTLERYATREDGTSAVTEITDSAEEAASYTGLIWTDMFRDQPDEIIALRFEDGKLREIKSQDPQNAKLLIGIMGVLGAAVAAAGAEQMRNQWNKREEEKTKAKLTKETEAQEKAKALESTLEKESYDVNLPERNPDEFWNRMKDDSGRKN